MMVSKSKRFLTVCFSLLFAMVAFSMSFAEPVRAQGSGKNSAPDKRKFLLHSSASSDEDGATSVHKDPATFEKNFALSFDQKEYTITECEKVVNDIIEPGMSDLEKYYTLAIWVNKHVKYDWNFWNGGYYFEYYSHQWDAYGAMKEDEKSVCVGIAIFYSNMCHAAGLPCRFVRLIPEYLDHTIDYIPDINGNAYYVDVTENVFLHSIYSDDAFSNFDKEFSHITKDCTDKSFDYQTNAESGLQSTHIKDFYNVPFEKWYNEFALHKNTKKIFPTKYIEKGSGESGKHYADYKDYISNFTDKPDVWFLDDFYKDPAAIKAKILNKEFDDQLVNVSGVKKNYECNTIDELEAAVAQDITVKYFPSSKDGEVVAKAANLTKDVDYKLVYKDYDNATKSAEFTVEGIGAYTGTHSIRVKMNSAVVAKDPVAKLNLVYNGSAQELVEVGQAENGEMQYALGTKTEATGAYSTDIPSATDAGKYYVWYKAVGDVSHGASEPQCLEKVVSIKPLPLKISVKDLTIKAGKTGVISPKLDKRVPVSFTFENLSGDLVSVDENGKVTGLKAGIGYVYVEAKLKTSSSNYTAPDSEAVRINVVKTANSLKLKAKKAAVKYKSLKKKSIAIKSKQLFAVKKPQGKLTYKLAAAKKGKKSVKNKFRVSKKTGKLIVKKGLKKGTYRVKVKVKATGNAKYKASGWKAVIFKVIVR